MRLFILSSLISLLLSSIAPAQLVEIPETRFSDHETGLRFRVFGKLGGPADNIGAAFGVHFSSKRGRIEMGWIGPEVWPGNTFPLIWNEPGETGTSADDALLIRFERPVRRLALNLVNGGNETIGKVSAMTPMGEPLGTVLKVVYPHEPDYTHDFGPVVSLETSHPEGMGTVVVDYGDESRAEAIYWMAFDYVLPTPFRLFQPQVALGRAGERRLTTILQVQSMSGARNMVTVRLFDDDGDRMSVRLDDGQEADSFSFELDRQGVRELRMLEPAETAVQVGYAMIESRYPVSTQTIYETASVSGSIVSEATLLAEEPRINHIVTVRKDAMPGLDTGIAIVNTTDQETSVRIEIRGASDPIEKPDGLTNYVSLKLGPHQQHSFFLSEYCDVAVFPEPGRARFCGRDFLAGAPFFGSLTINSRHPTAVTPLRTRNGLPVSSARAGSTERR